MHGAENDGHALEAVGEATLLLGVPDGPLPGRVRQRHDVRAFVGWQLQATGEVRVDDVEAARPEIELACLDVHEHLVPDLHRAGQIAVVYRRYITDLAAQAV